METFSDRLSFGGCCCRSFFLLFVLAAEGKHLVASRIEALPDLFGVFTRNGTDFLPQAAEMLDLVHRGDDRLIVQVGEQVFGLFAEENLLLEIVLASLFLNVELVAAAGEEVIADIAECLAEFVIIVTARTEREPFLLDVSNGIGLRFRQTGGPFRSFPASSS